jgi:hypothetical protein
MPSGSVRRSIPYWRCLFAFMGLVVAANAGRLLADRRDVAVGIIAAVFYGILLGGGQIRSKQLRQWSQRHVVAGPLILVPSLFFALLLISSLALWVAAVTSIVVGAAIPWAVRRRPAATTRQRDATSAFEDLDIR